MKRQFAQIAAWISGLCWCSGLVTVLLASAVQASSLVGLDFLGQAQFATGAITVQGTQVGGLSGIAYDPSRNCYYSISDDRSQINPARFYTLSIDLSQGGLSSDKVAFTDVTLLRDRNGQLFAPLSLDPEGIALTRNHTLWISSEGDANRSINPLVGEFTLTGQQLRTLPIPEKFLPSSPAQGIRNNLALESLTVTPNQQTLWTATENALVQDGPVATLDLRSPSRLLKYDLSTGKPEQEYLYLTEPVAAAAKPTTGLSTTGLADLLALDNEGHFLSLERSFSTGVGNTIQLFEISLAGADDISALYSLSALDLSKLKPVHKKLLLNLNTLNLPLNTSLDNVEGVTFGPLLPDGRQSLVLVSDNNFSSTQSTQILALGVRIQATRSSSRPNWMGPTLLLLGGMLLHKQSLFLNGD
ncbi:esterase-like activity of phytase family protein [Leptolyngbya sp. FACHB-261]|uniref:esterase-like activity of phytase family protein n=1 Tax=Leptolyngbya sp. FACHB-261 TaxID=2692806 RepID=UPI001684AD08|nr:esterase-like activity of phytase family protein [Leptolyngbya sp. FACHB-261]MBD2104170.1 esterase-like activity of phytase family protein [Leptolyngbya sp. FACHB-261]